MEQNKEGSSLQKENQWGTGSANFILYYWATGTRSMVYWFDDNPIPNDGLEMEQEDCLPYSIRAVVLFPVPVNRAGFKHNPIIFALRFGGGV